MVTCPICDSELTWQPRPHERMAGYCPRHHGPVIEIDADNVEVDSTMEVDAEVIRRLMQLPGISKRVAKNLFMRGLNSYEKIRDASDQQLLATDGIGQARIEQIRRYLAEYFADD